MRITRDRIHLEPDGVLLIGVAGPILIRSETVREMIEALLSMLIRLLAKSMGCGRTAAGWKPVTLN